MMHTTHLSHFMISTQNTKIWDRLTKSKHIILLVQKMSLSLQ